MKLIKGLLGFVIILIVLGVGIGGYFGLIPGVSNLFGANKPKNLGVTYSQADFESVNKKGGAERTALASATAEKTLVYEGSVQVNDSFSSSELTALTNKYDRWVNNPFSQVQIRIFGNTGEVSGVVNMNTMFTMIKYLGYSQAQIDEAMTKYHIPRADIPFYIKGTAAITNNQGSLNLSAVELGRVPVPQALVSQYQGEVAQFAMSAMRTIPSLDIQSATLANDKLNVKGTLPNKQSTVTTSGKVLTP
jgi:hypothetical protein